MKTCTKNRQRQPDKSSSGLDEKGKAGSTYGMNHRPLLFAVIAAAVWLPFSLTHSAAQQPASAQPATRPTPPPVTLANPWRWKGELEAFAAADTKAHPAPGGIVFTGSSSVRLWKLNESFPDLPVISRGLGGSHTSDAVFFIDKTVLQYRPKVVVLFVGSNDLDAGRPVDVVVDNLQRFAELLKATAPDTRLIMMAIKPSPSRSDNYDKTREANEKLGKVAERLGFKLVNPEAGLAGPDGAPNEAYFQKDKLHYNEAGYKIVTSALDPVLRRVWAEVNQ